MHPATFFHETDDELPKALIALRGFALIIGANGGRAAVAHAPVILRDGRLRFHLSTANALCPILRANPRALVVVTGPDAYVSPDWYAAEDQVPTWNYQAAEIEGPVRVLARDEAARLLDDLTAHFEARLAPKRPWTRAKLSPAKFEAMLSAITGFEVRSERLGGTSKLSQNKAAQDIARVARHLRAQTDESSRRIAQLMDPLAD